MNEYKYRLAIANQDEWSSHLEEVVRHREGKTEYELVEGAFAFDFKFSLIEL